MAKVSVEDDQVVVRLTGWEKLGALRRRDVRFPLGAVRAVRPAEQPFAEIRGYRAPGTSVPRLMALGTWRDRGERDFVAVYRNRPGVVVELDRLTAGLDRLLLTAPEPADLIASLSP